MQTIRHIIVILGIMCSTVGYGQFMPQSSLYMFDKYRENVAYGGLDYSLSVNLHVRNQWQKLDGSPAYLSLNAHLPFYVWSGAIGTQVGTRSLGAFRQNNVTVSYNYVLDLGFGLWSTGVRAGLSQLSLDGASVTTPDGTYTDGVVVHNDPILPNNLETGLAPIWEVGTYFKGRSVEVGLALSGLPSHEYQLGDASLKKKLHVTGYGQYSFRFSDKIDVLQSVLLKSNFNSVQTDITSIAKINGNIFGGVGLRGYSSTSLDAVTVLFGVQFSKHYTLMYSYDASVSGIKDANEGSHELILNYNLQKVIGTGLPPKIIYNTRFL